MKVKTQTRKICDEEYSNCENCSINGKLMCSFNIRDTIYFVVPVFSVWIIWIIGLIVGFFSRKIEKCCSDSIVNYVWGVYFCRINEEFC